MAAMQGIWNSTAAQASAAATNTKPTANADSSDSSSSTSDSATISANDFLTLLVTEMQNQDPTATTDPNEYINQLVNVNSLEQLISINQTLTGAMGTTSDSQSTGSGSTQFTSQAAEAASRMQSTLHTAPVSGGNLSVPQSSMAAQRVATALSGAHSK